MLPKWSFQLNENPLQNGLRLAALNFALAIVCIFIFVGTLGTLSLISSLFQTYVLPFPFLVLLILFTIIFLATWVGFAKRLRLTQNNKHFQTSFIGAIPLLGLSLLGYINVILTLVFGDFNANQMLEASVWIYGVISTLILMSGLSCIVLINLIAQQRSTQ